MNNNDIKKQLIKLRRDKRFLWLAILFFVLVVLWILVSIVATTKASSISPELRDLAKSFVPRLESKVFEEISAKRIFSVDELSLFPIYVLDKESTKESVDNSPAVIDIMSSSDLLATKSNQLNTKDETTKEQNLPVLETDLLPIPIEDIIGPQN